MFFGKKKDDRYRIVVTSTVHPSPVELKRSYDRLNECFLHSRPFDLHESLQGLVPTAGEKLAMLKKFAFSSNTCEVLDWAEENGYRPAFPWEREAFAKANPNLQNSFPIVDVGSHLHQGGRHFVPILDDGGLVSDEGGPLRPGRTLDVGIEDYWSDPWDATHRFLLIKKE